MGAVTSRDGHLRHARHVVGRRRRLGSRSAVPAFGKADPGVAARRRNSRKQPAVGQAAADGAERSACRKRGEAAHQDRFEIERDGLQNHRRRSLAATRGLFTRCYVLPEAVIANRRRHGDEGDSSFRAALLNSRSLDAWPARKRETNEQLNGLFPAKEFDRVSCLPSTSPRAFSLILLGQSVVAVGRLGIP